MKTILDKIPHGWDFRRFNSPKNSYCLQINLHPKIKSLFLAASLLVVPYFANSQDIAYKENFFEQNKEAQLSSSSNKKVYKKDIFGNTIVQDENGRVIATIKKDIFGNQIEEDGKGGRKVYKKDIHGNTIVKDEKGNTIATFKQDIFGNQIEEDGTGGKKVYKKDIFGNIVVQDGSGRVIGTYKKDISGNPVFQSN